MTKAALPQTQSVKVLCSEGGMGVSYRVITSIDAIRGGLPLNCVVIPMRILEHPEPIKRSRK